MKNSKLNWLDVALGRDIKRYISNGRKIIRFQKFIFAVNKESYIKLGVFIDRLEAIRKGVPSLEAGKSWASPKKDDSIYEFISEAPDFMRKKLEEITYDRDTGQNIHI